MKSFSIVLKVLLSVTIALFFLSGCKMADSNSEGASSNSENRVLSLKRASAEDMAETEYIMACSSNEMRGKSKRNRNRGGSGKDESKAKACVLICHVPPGNPDAAHELILPLQAVRAHLNHGSDRARSRRNPAHAERDSIGPCGDADDDGSGDDGSGDDGSGDDGSGDDGGMDMGGDDVGIGSDDPVYDDPIVTDDPNTPQYCVDNRDIDPDCDGVDDQTDEFLY